MYYEWYIVCGIPLAAVYVLPHLPEYPNIEALQSYRIVCSVYSNAMCRKALYHINKYETHILHITNHDGLSICQSAEYIYSYFH